jgi:hypothetical protein
MKKTDRNLLLFSVLFMALSGIGLFLLDEFFKIETDYGLRSNPWIDDVKFVHNLFNFLFIFSVGKIFNCHIIHGLKLIKKKHQITGFSIFLSILGLVFTGTLLLYITDEEYSSDLRSIHWYLGVIFSTSFIFHKLAHLRDLKKTKNYC